MWHYSGVDEGVLTFMLEWRGQYCPRMTIFWGVFESSMYNKPVLFPFLSIWSKKLQYFMKVTLQILCFFAVYKQRFCNDIAKKWSRSQRWRPTFIILWNVVTVPKADLQWVYIFEKFAAHCMMCWTLIEKEILFEIWPNHEIPMSMGHLWVMSEKSKNGAHHFIKFLKTVLVT